MSDHQRAEQIRAQANLSNLRIPCHHPNLVPQDWLAIPNAGIGAMLTHTIVQAFYCPACGTKVKP